MSNIGLAILLAIIACIIGGALGGFAIARPQDVLAMVGLKPDEEKPHALSEARASYGGLFLLSHAGTAAALGYSPGVGACMALALGLAWLGAAAVRLYDIASKGAATRFNVRAAIFEFLMGATLILPFWSYARLARAGGVLV